jgi:hypothetical protein
LIDTNLLFVVIGIRNKALFLIPITTNNKLVSIKFDENEKMLRIINMKNINLSSADRKRLTKLVNKL